jgi:hypothetical protein
LPPDARDELQQTFFFKREPCVKRVVFVGTPHRGSKLSPSPLGRLAAHLAQMPSDLLTARADLIKDNPDLAKLLRERALPTSVDLLAPESKALQLMANRPRPEKVHYHTIAGVTSTATTVFDRLLAGDLGDPGDGVVPYKSARIDDADSELVVRADHFHVHHHPLAIQEVRRILMEHYQEYIRQQEQGRELRLTVSDAEKKGTPKP